MANVKELKKRIKTTKGTLKITSAMKLVSAAKLAKAQIAIQNARPYASELNSTIKVVSALAQNYTHPFLKEHKGNKAIILVISSDKGLCGSYNGTLSKKVLNFIKDNPETDFKVYFIGKKAKELISKSVSNVGTHYKFAKVVPTYSELKDVAEELSSLYSEGEAQKVYVAYNIFISAISLEPAVSQLLPMTLPLEEKQRLEKEFPFDFEYEPSGKEILDALIPQAYVTTIYTALLDAVAAEHGARMSSMENATQNCKELVYSLSLEMNKLRQENITTELIEVVSGAESVNN
ncbi:MAG: ATP synthase F1 subunit gamma [Bacteriovoracaceae bacterium]